MPRATTYDPYPALRSALAPEYAEASADEIEAVLGRAGVSAENLESFWQSLAQFGRQAAPIAQQALPIAGTVLGTAFGGPAGAMIGGAAGNALSGAIGGAVNGPDQGRGNRALAGLSSGALQGLSGGGGGLGGLGGGLGALLGGGMMRGGQAGPAAAGLAAPAAFGGGASAAGGGSSAAAQLLQLLARPELMQAILSMALGAAGRPQVAVGQTSAPVGAFTNLLGVLANQASAEHHQLVAGEAAGTPAYLLDGAGEFLADPADPVQRASVLLSRLGQAEAAAASERAAWYAEWDTDLERFQSEQDEALRDELELYALELED